MVTRPWDRVAIVPFAVCLAILGAGGTAALGQPIGESVDSLEWMAVNSARVVRGTIVALKTERRPEGDAWRIVTFRVDETLKGVHQPSVRCVVWTNGREHELDRWKQQGRPLLLFLEESRCAVALYRQPEYARFPFAPRSGEPQRSFVDIVPNGGGPAYTADLQALDKPEEILRAVRAAVAGPSGLGMPCSAWLRFPGKGDLLRVTVPVDARLEARGQAWVKSQDKELRREAPSALMFFQSDANVALLRGLLDDPGAWNVGVEEGGRIVRHERWYGVREEAYKLLRAWGIDVPRPVVRE